MNVMRLPKLAGPVMNMKRGTHPLRRVSAPAAALLLACTASACAPSRFSYDDLPAHPVALVVREERDTKRLEEYIRRDNEARAEKRSNLPLRDPLERARELVDWTLEVRARGTRFGRLVFLDPNERETERVEFALADERPLAWNAARTRLLFASARRGRSTQVFEWNKESGEVRQMTFGPPHIDAVYGPGGRIAAVRVSPLSMKGERVVGGLQIWTMGSAGADARRLSDGPLDIEPAWSPDGRVLVFEGRDLEGIDNLFRIDPAGAAAPRRIRRGNSPVFTPDGRWVIYSARTRSGLKIFRMHPDGTGPRNIGKSSYQELSPTVSADGRYVLFIGFGESSESGPRLYVRDIESGTTRTLNIEDEGFVPAW